MNIFDSLDPRDLGLRGSDPFFISTYIDAPVLFTPRIKFHEILEEFRVNGYVPGEAFGQLKFKRLESRKKDVAQLYQNISDIQLFEDLDPEHYPDFLATGLELSQSMEFIERPAFLAEKIYTWAIDGIDSHIGIASATPTKGKLASRKMDFSIWPEEFHWYSRWRTLDSIVQYCAKRNSQKKERFLHFSVGSETEVYRNEAMCLIKRDHGSGKYGRIALTWEQLVMLKDICYTRAETFSAVRALYPSDATLRTAISSLIQWHDECLIRYGNEGYEILKTSESLSKAYLSVAANDPLGEQGPFQRMVDKIIKKEQKLAELPSYKRTCSLSVTQADKFKSILESTESVQQVVELFGLQKISGYPLIDPYRGARAVKKTSREPDLTTPENSDRIAWNFKRMFLESWVSVNGWPNLIFSDTSTELYRLYAARKRNFHRNSYPLSDWKTCEFGRIFDFDFAPNYLELMDDKAIAYYRSNIAAAWDNSIEAQSDRRLLLELLGREDVDPKELIYKVMRREIPRDWKIVCLYPKEKEFKIDPRMFAMMVFEMRMIWQLLENNLADNVFKFMPQQTMTKSRADTMKMFLDLTKPPQEGDMLNLFIESDLSQWCQHWRALTVHKVGDVIETMFDTPGAYSYIHTFFNESMMVVRVKDCKPEGIEKVDPPESDLLYYDDLGGKEGIQQKLWTLCTYSMMDLALQDLPLSYRLIGQGDNQVVSLRFHRRADMSDKDQLINMRDTVLERLQAECEKVGQDLKPDECLESTTVITYSKDVYVNGVVRPTSLKFHNKIFPHSSQDFPSIRSDLGAVFSTALAAAERSADPIRSYYIALLHGSMFLFDKLKGRGIHGDWVKDHTSRLSNENKEDLVTTMLTIPSELGGFPIAGPAHFMYKGGSDPLNKSIAGLQLLELGAKSKLINRVLAQLSMDDLYKKDASMLSFLKDPYSLPLTTPVTATDGATDMTITALLPSISNRDISQLLSENVSSYGERLAECLGKVEPFNPIMLKDILEASVYGIADTIKKMFTATRTIQSVARRHDSQIVPRVLDMERDQFVYLCRRYTTLPTTKWRKETPYDMTVRLRERWVKAGLPFPIGVCSYSPFDFPVAFGPSELSLPGIHAVLTTTTENASERRGQVDPYVGGKTKEKRSEHGYKIADSHTTAESFRKLQLIISQIHESEDLKTVIDLVGLSRSNTVLSSVSENLESVRPGNSLHRYDSRAGHQASYNMGSPNFATHCLISSDNAGRLSGGLEDYPVMLQPLFLFALWLLQYCSSEGTENHKVVRICTEDVDMDPLPGYDLRYNTDEFPEILRFTSNKLAFVDRLRIEKLTARADLLYNASLNSRTSQITIQSRADRRRILEGWFADRLRERSLARSAADGGTNMLATAAMDLAELLASGLDITVEACANVVADSFLMNALRTVGLRRERWNALVFCSQVSEACCRLFSSHIGHPLLRNDRLVRRYQLYDSPTYRPEAARTHERLRGIVQTLALQNVILSPRAYSTRRTITFSVSKGFTDVEGTLTALSRIIQHAVTIKVIDEGIRRHIVDHFILPALRTPSDSAARLLAIEKSTSELEKWSRKTGRYDLAHMVKGIQEGKYCGVTTLSSKELLRMTREVVFQIGDHAWIPMTKKGTEPFRKDDHYYTFYETGDHPLQSSTIATSASTRSRFPLSDRLRAVYSANCGQLLGSGSEIFSQLCEFPEYMEGRVVFAIGVGEGSTSAAAIVSGAAHVIGLDLSEDLPLRPHRFTSYCPPLVHVVGGEDQFTLHPVCITTTGDWFDPAVSSIYLEELSSTATVVIDLEMATPDRLVDTLIPLAQDQFEGAVLLRAMASEHQICELASDLKLSRARFRIVSLGIVGERDTILLVMSSFPRELLKCDRFLSIKKAPVSLVGNEYPQLKPLRIQMQDSVFNVIIINDNMNWDEVAPLILDLYMSMVGHESNRLSYDQFTHFVRALISSMFAMLPANRRLTMLTELAVTQNTIVKIGGKTFRFSTPPVLLRHLVTCVARTLSS